MLKKFFISMLGTMAGLWLSLIIFGIVSVMAVVMLVAKSSNTVNVTDNSVLYIDLTGNISECESKLSLSDIMNIAEDETDDLASILSAIRMAADDKHIKGIYINCGGSTLGIASRSEIVEALKEFKKSSKWVYAYADEYSQGDYYVATAADSVYLNPVGSVTISGLSSSTIFFKDVLAKLGIDVEVVRVGSFKSAVEPFLRMDMSPESRMQTEVFLKNIWENVTSTIAINRGLKNPEVVNAWADSISFTWAPERYVAQNAVTSLRYRSQVEDMMRQKLDIDNDEDLPLVSPTDYMSVKSLSKITESSDHIAVLYAVGEIYVSGSEGITSEAMVPEILNLAKDEHVKGLILRVNSGGGSAFASEQIWHALEDFKATGKPFYVSMGDYAASGGYYISCGADKIYSDPATLTGSIGIFGIIPNAEQLIQKKIGLKIESVETNPNANFPSLYVAPTKQQIAAMQTYVERGYDTFTARVSEGRNIPVDSVKAIGGGRVWDGISALNIGLVDELGGIDKAINAMAKATGLSADDAVAYPKIESTVLDALIKESKKSVEIKVDGLSAEEAKECYDYVKKIKNIAPIQARMPYTIIR